MDISTLFQQIFEALSKATEIAVSNRKSINDLTQSQAELTIKLTEATADDEADAAKIAAFEEEKAKQDAAIADITKKLEELKAQLESTPPVEPAPTLPPEPTPDPVIEVPPVVAEPTPESPVESPVVETPVEVPAAPSAPAIGVFEPVILPGSQPPVF